MPVYFETQPIENTKPQSDFDKINMFGANNLMTKPVEPEEEVNELVGGRLSDIMNADKPYREMITAVLKMKPKDIHLIKRGAKYFLDNPNELDIDIDEGALDDLSQVKSSNELADMLENDFEMSKGGEDQDGSLLRELANLLDELPKLNKILKI